MKSRLLHSLILLVAVIAVGYFFVYEGFWVWVVENTKAGAPRPATVYVKGSPEADVGCPCVHESPAALPRTVIAWLPAG